MLCLSLQKHYVSLFASMSLSFAKLSEISNLVPMFQGSSASEIQWLEWIGKMAYALEREKTMQQIQPIGMPMEDLRENIDRNINVPAALNAKSSTEENGTETSVSSKRTIDDINETDVKWQLGKMAYSANQHHWISKVHSTLLILQILHQPQSYLIYC